MTAFSLCQFSLFFCLNRLRCALCNCVDNSLGQGHLICFGRLNHPHNNATSPSMEQNRFLPVNGYKHGYHDKWHKPGHENNFHDMVQGRTPTNHSHERYVDHQGKVTRLVSLVR